MAEKHLYEVIVTFYVLANDEEDARNVASLEGSGNDGPFDLADVSLATSVLAEFADCIPIMDYGTAYNLSNGYTDDTCQDWVNRQRIHN